jgi:hypothetical protein
MLAVGVIFKRRPRNFRYRPSVPRGFVADHYVHVHPFTHHKACTQHVPVSSNFHCDHPVFSRKKIFHTIFYFRLEITRFFDLTPGGPDLYFPPDHFIEEGNICGSTVLRAL